jgi:Cu(I)/Ag(I) efflux system protein CusF
MRFLAVFVTVTALLFAGAARAQAQHEASGKVTKVDRSAGRVTIAHGSVASLNWPAMTMAFDVKDKSLLDKAKVGETIQFTLVESNRKHVITAIK